MTDCNEIDTAFNAIEKHPFTIISLADREKFHTGMIAFLLNEIDASSQLKLIKKLWGEENCDALKISAASKLKCFVEQDSIDLVIKDQENEKNEIKLWAEMKFKTTLSEGQIDKYKEKTPDDSVGALFALLTDVDNIPELQGKDGKQRPFNEIAFHEAILDFNNDNPLVNFISNKVEDRQRDKIALVRLWLEYLGFIKKLTDFTKDAGLNPIEGGFANKLHKIKLKGIFEHYRYSLFRKELENLIKTNEDRKTIEKFKINQFNSHGNSGIEYVIHPYPDIIDENKDNSKKTKLPTRDYHMSFGLQWQAKSLKLFVTMAKVREYTNDRLERYAPLERENISNNRDKKLGILYHKFAGEQWVNEGSKRNNSEGSLFKSYTIEKWDIFEPKLRAGDPNAGKDGLVSLTELAASLWKRLPFLAGDDCNKLILEVNTKPETSI